ncbi:ArsR/SmtB family transcription factor [Phreatobacter stygius]|nr:metalloregulator ArsR/SmtB family transcription factor [Phreatobacter stygius]
MSDAEIFRALADPTRRAVFERLADGEKNATELRAGSGISQPAMSQHLGVLRQAGLVVERRQGRHVNYRVNPDGLAQMFEWLQRYRAFWPERVEALKQLLKEMDQ